jgi:hypothetical protein
VRRTSVRMEPISNAPPRARVSSPCWGVASMEDRRAGSEPETQRSANFGVRPKIGVGNRLRRRVLFPSDVCSSELEWDPRGHTLGTIPGEVQSLKFKGQSGARDEKPRRTGVVGTAPGGKMSKATTVF